MKKLIFCSLAVAGSIGLASCSSEEPAVANGSDVVTFTASIPDRMMSRADDGDTPLTLMYAVYDTDGGKVVAFNEAGAPEVAYADSKYTVSIPLVHGKEYSFVFWAQSDKSDAYDFDTENGTVAVNYDKMELNDDSHDVFFTSLTKTVDGNGESVTLRRPMAQVNVATDDYVDGITTKLSLSNIHTTLDLRTGVASGAVETAVNTFSGLEPYGKITLDDKEYHHMAMAYVLTGSELEGDDLHTAKPETMNMQLEFSNGRNHRIDNVPVRRNNRTNLYGSLLSSTSDFTIDLDHGFSNDTNVELTEPWDGTTKQVPQVDDEGTATVTSAAEFVGLASAMSTGELTTVKSIVLDSDIDLGGNLFDGFGREGLSDPANYESKYKILTVNFDGKGHTVSNFKTACNYRYGSGLFTWLGNGSVVRNLTVENVQIGQVRQGNMYGVIAGYAYGVTLENITVRNCKITAFGKVGGLIGIAYPLGGNNIPKSTITNCKVENVEITCGYEGGGYIGLIYENHDVEFVGCTEPTVTFKKYDSDLEYYYTYSGSVLHTAEKDGQGSVMPSTLLDMTGEFYATATSSWAHVHCGKWFTFLPEASITEKTWLSFMLTPERLCYVGSYPVNTPATAASLYRPSASTVTKGR